MIIDPDGIVDGQYWSAWCNYNRGIHSSCLKFQRTSFWSGMILIMLQVGVQESISWWESYHFKMTSFEISSMMNVCHDCSCIKPINIDRQQCHRDQLSWFAARGWSVEYVYINIEQKQTLHVDHSSSSSSSSRLIESNDAHTHTHTHTASQSQPAKPKQKDKSLEPRTQKPRASERIEKKPRPWRAKQQTAKQRA
jgi:hypothetical protein